MSARPSFFPFVMFRLNQLRRVGDHGIEIDPSGIHELFGIGLGDFVNDARKYPCAFLILERLRTLQQHIERQMARPDVLDARADELVVVLDHHWLQRLRNIAILLRHEWYPATLKFLAHDIENRAVRGLGRSRLEEIDLPDLIVPALCLGVVDIVLER